MPLTNGKARAKRKTQTVAIAFHEGHAAINVKYRSSLYDATVPEHIAKRAYDATVQEWWGLANEHAQALGYSGVFSEGRSGGWLVPYYQYRNGKLYQGAYDGQGPDKGFPVYPDVVKDAKERARFKRLQAKVAELMREVPELYKWKVSFYTEEANENSSEAKITEKQAARLLELLWESMKRDVEHSDRVQTGWGTKTQAGLIACIERIVFEER